MMSEFLDQGNSEFLSELTVRLLIITEFFVVSSRLTSWYPLPLSRSVFSIYTGIDLAPIQ